MARYLETQKKWQYLNTSFVKEDSTYAYFEALSPGFSTFAILTEAGASSPPVVVTSTETEAQNSTKNQSSVPANTTSNSTGAVNTTAEPPKATGFAISDIPKSPVFMGVLIFLAVIAIIIAVIRITGRNSVELR